MTAKVEMAHKMSGAVAVTVAVVVLVVATGGGVGGVRAEVHHVVGGDRGWEPSNIIGDWSSSRVFTVGDIICKYSSLSLYISSYAHYRIERMTE